MRLDDRFTRGFLAGVAGGVAMNLIDYGSFYLFRVAEERLLDYAAELIFDHRASTLAEAIIAQGAQLLFAGVLGILFAYSILKVKSVNYLFKGWLYGVTVWFTIYGVGRLFEALEHISGQSAASTLVSASLYGLVMAETLRWFDHKTRV